MLAVPASYPAAFGTLVTIGGALCTLGRLGPKEVYLNARAGRARNAHRGDRPEHPFVVPGHIADGRQQQQRGVHLGAIEGLHVHASLAVVAAPFDGLPQLVARLHPAPGRRPAHAFVGEADAVVER